MRRFVCSVFLIASVAAARADLFTYTFTGPVSTFVNRTGTFTGKIARGNVFTSSGTVDGSVPPFDTNPAPSAAAAYSLIGNGLSIGTFSMAFQTVSDSLNSAFVINAASVGSGQADSYSIFETQDVGSVTLKGGTQAPLIEETLSASLEDTTDQAVTSTALPKSINLAAFNLNSMLFEYSVFSGPTDGTATQATYTTDIIAAGSVTSATVQDQPVPEPACLLSLGIPSLALLRRRRSA